MIVMPCKKLAHTPTPLLRYFPSKRRHLGGDLLSVHVTEIEAKRKDMKEAKMSHPGNRTRRAHTQSQSSPRPPGGMRDWFPRNTLHVHGTETRSHATMACTYIYIHTYTNT